MDNLYIDSQVAQKVFGVSAETLDAWPWPPPEFSTDRRWSAAVVSKLAVSEKREAFESELEKTARANGWKQTPEFSGTATLLMVLTPQEICEAALTAIE